MKVPFRQTTPYGCGHYTLANLFNDERFLGFVTPYAPSDTYQMSRLTEDLYGMWLRTIFCVNTSLPIQNRFIDVDLFDMNFQNLDYDFRRTHFRPFLMTIKGNVLFHLILVCHNLINDMFYVVDSLNEDIKVMKKEEFVYLYYVVEVFVFENKEIVDSCATGSPGQLELYMNYNILSHLKP